MTTDRKKQVTLDTDSDLEIDPGLVLPPGRYWAIETRTAPFAPECQFFLDNLCCWLRAERIVE